MEDRPVNAALDTFNELRDALRGAGGRGLGELNERLRAEFEEFRMDSMDDGVIGVVPVLRRREIDLSWDWYATYKEWIDAGQPEPTEEEIAAYHRQEREERRRDRAEEPIWADGKEMIRPPAKPLMVQQVPGPPFRV